MAERKIKLYNYIVNNKPSKFLYVRGAKNYYSIYHDIEYDIINDETSRQEGTYKKTTLKDYAIGFELQGLDFDLKNYRERYLPVVCKDPYYAYKYIPSYDTNELKCEDEIDYDDEDDNYDDDDVIDKRVCLCGRIIKNFYVIYDIQQKLFILVGSECVKRHFPNLKITKTVDCLGKGCIKRCKINSPLGLCRMCYKKILSKHLCIKINSLVNKFVNCIKSKMIYCSNHHLLSSKSSTCKICECPVCHKNKRGKDKTTGKYYSSCYKCFEMKMSSYVLCKLCREHKHKPEYIMCWNCSRKKNSR